MSFNKHKTYFLFLLVITLSNHSWSQNDDNDPPVIFAVGNQPYCPGDTINIVENITITDSDDSGIEAMYIQISTGYRNGEDSLILTGTHPNISDDWDQRTGKLKLYNPSGAEVLYTDFVAAIKDVVYTTTNTNASDSRYFSITIGDANYLPSTDHYYEYVPSSGITWTSAKTAAENSTYFGLQGYLATITSAAEAQLSGEQANGAGWLGGSDAETADVWKWVTGPEAGDIFWNGKVNGSTPPGGYENWNANEPNDYGDGANSETYAHVTFNVGPPGTWNDLPNAGSNGNYYPQGYIVEYGGMPGDPILNISASTSIHIPTITFVDGDERCGEGSLILHASTNSGTINWFDVQTGGIPIGTGTTFNTPTISDTTTFYAMATINGCTKGERISVQATINQIPIITSTTEDTICFNGSATLVATATAGEIKWYDSPVDGIVKNLGATFITPNISVTTTYYVETNDGCASLRVPVTVTVYSPPDPTGDAIQYFCKRDNNTVADLTTTSGTNIQWYDTLIDGTAYTGTEILIDGQTYYASQHDGTCESYDRLTVNAVVYNSVTPLNPSEIDSLAECDDNIDGDDTNGFKTFDLTSNADILVNGEPLADFDLTYFTDAGYSSQISTPNSFTNTIVGGQTIYVRMTNKLESTCFTDTAFEIEVLELPVLNTPPFELAQCDDNFDGFNVFNLTEINAEIVSNITSEVFTYYLSPIDAANATNPISDPIAYTNQIANVDDTVWVRIENENGCFRTTQIILIVKPSAIPTDFLVEFFECDSGADTTDGVATFDLSSVTPLIEAIFPVAVDVYYYRNEADATSEINEIEDPSNYQNIGYPNMQEIWVRADSQLGNDCLGNGHHVTLTVHPLPQFEVEPEAIVCLNLPPITLETYNPDGDYVYQWTDESSTIISNDPTVTVSSGGVYTVTASYITSSGLSCQSLPRKVTVSESIIATITNDDITVSDDSSNNSITINTDNLGIGDYEFTLDNEFGVYQDEPYFDMVEPDIHTVFVRDKNGCGIASIEVSVIGFPGFFTPNNDGYNDYWQVRGVSADFYPSSLIYIYNRFGKLISKVDPTIDGWNGYYNGEMLPADDYWFSVQLIDQDGNIRDRKGHFSLIRR